MNQLLMLFFTLSALIIATISLYQQPNQPFYLKIEVQYEHGGK
jgi:hypothetical protein